MGVTGTTGSGHRKNEASMGFGISEMSFSARFGSDDDVKKEKVPTAWPLV
eukprot:TRINITY_DN3583_c0_g1_i1.p4 TRINITY_DN3583_c0_g1~~TRINITY_DN3583_c0_g1_i1.p4  ORF type:complete len:50 (+),score=22.10 TRINITY_DN3583_c0_g1_i1:453-602(+)